MIEMVMTVLVDPAICSAASIARTIVPGYGIEGCEIAETGDEVLVYALGMAGGTSLRAMAGPLRRRDGVLAVRISRPRIVPRGR